MEDEYSRAVSKYYEIYEPLRKKYHLRERTHSSIYCNDDALIEIWEYHGETRGKRICRVKEEDTAECYRRAADILEEYKRRKEKQEHGRNADMAV